MSEAQEREGMRIIRELVSKMDIATRCEIGDRDFDTGVYEVRLTRDAEEATLRVSREDMEDLPATAEIQEEIRQRLQIAIDGIRRPESRAYVTRSGCAFRLELGPREYLAPVRAVYAHNFKIENMRAGGESAAGQVAISRFAHNTFFSDSRQELRVCINRIRTALDEDEIRFGEDPKDLLFADDKWVRDILYRTQIPQLSEDEIREFIIQKLYWVGYYALSDINQRIPLDDLTDCEYLGVRASDIKRNAGFLQGERLLSLSPEGDELLAVPTSGLIRQIEERDRSKTTRPPRHGFLS
jgi:hypothetical protein